MKASAAPPTFRHAAARPHWALALVLGVTACSTSEIKRIPRQHHHHPVFSHATHESRAHREMEMNQQWQNRPLSDLVVALGRPKLVMHIPGGGSPPSFAVVYDQDTGTGCIDAFAVSSTSEPVVRIYHCR